MIALLSLINPYLVIWDELFEFALNNFTEFNEFSESRQNPKVVSDNR